MKKSLVIFFLLLSAGFFAQRGEYFIQNYLPKDYNHGPNNNGATQDREGRIFIANQNGVLIYDGINWQMFTLPDQITVYSILSDSKGTVYVGADNGEFGLVEKDKKGRYYYTSLKQNLQPKDQPAEPVKQIVQAGDALYFLSADKLVEYRSGGFKAFAPHNSFHIRALVMGRHLFVTDLDQNLMVLNNGVLNYVANAGELASKKAFFCYRIDRATFAVGYRNDGFYRVSYDSLDPAHSRFEKWDVPFNAEMNEAEINNGCLLRDGRFIITSNKKGAFLINRDLEVVKRFNSGSGIYEDNIKSAFQDRNSNLWLSTYYGMSYIEFNTRLFKFDRQNGITGLVSSACYYGGGLYLSTDKGVQFINDKEAQFRMLPGFNKQTWFLLSKGKTLLMGTDKGLFSYDGKQTQQWSDKKTFCLMSDPAKKELVYAGTEEGVEMYKCGETKLELVKIFQLNYPVKSMASDGDGTIYFGCETNGIYYLDKARSFALDSIQQREGLPQQVGENNVFAFRRKLLVGTDSGIYTLVRRNDARLYCERSPEFHPLTQGTEIFRGAELGGDLLCSQSYENKKLNKVENKIVYFSGENGRFVINTEITNRLKDTKANQISYDSAAGTAFISTDEGLFLLERQKKKIERSFNFFLTWVITGGDTIIQNLSVSDEVAAFNFVVPFESNQLNFYVGYNCFGNRNAVEFSYYIEGRDKEYSPWSTQNLIRTPNLHEGTYIMHLRARSDLDRDIQELRFLFVVQPPWYRTLWAYAGYAVLFILFLVVVIRLNSRRLVEKNLKLEAIIRQRTSTIEEQVVQLEKQKHELQHQKKEITDSINYAQRIQQAILPSASEIGAAYNGIFVFFQPKDIVSGDFYWFHRIGSDEFLIACADCTGHGVPGAFMSTICSEKLTEAALQDPEPAGILYSANNAIKKVLKQESAGEGRNKDGMEIALVRYNARTKQLSYAGANRPAWIIRAGSKELTELKPAKASVASFTPFDFEYSQQQLVLEPGDMVYLTSDGYPDQFGGPEGRKFMTRNMKQFLQTIMHLPVDEQRQQVAVKINEWKGELEQVDDLLVIGIRG